MITEEELAIMKAEFDGAVASVKQFEEDVIQKLPLLYEKIEDKKDTDLYKFFYS